MSHANEKSSHIDDGIDLLDIFAILKHKLNFILIFCFIITFSTGVYLIFATSYYSSYISIYPMAEKNDMSNTMGDIQGLASSFGINIGGSSVTSFYIPDIVTSRKLGKAIVSNRWNVENNLLPIDLISFWEINDTTGFSIKRMIKGLFSIENEKELKSVYVEIALSKLANQIEINEKESGLFFITVLTKEPQLSADIANFIANYVRDYISREMTIQSTKFRLFIEDRLQHSKEDLSNNEEKLTLFRKFNPIALDDPDLQMQRGRLIRDVETSQQVYLTLLTQYELAKLEELKEMPVINILDNAEPSVEIAEPNKKFLLILSSILSMFIASSFVLFRHFGLIKNHRN